jgi:hypothetical protein
MVIDDEHPLHHLAIVAHHLCQQLRVFPGIAPICWNSCQAVGS